MISARIAQHYGFGAARLRLCPEPYRRPQHLDTLREGFQELRGELGEQGLSGALRGVSGVVSAFALALVLVWLLAFHALTGSLAFSSIELVPFETPPPVAEVAPPEVVEVVQELAVVEEPPPPPPPPEPAPRVVAPEPPVIAQQPVVPPPEPARAKPAPAPPPEPARRPIVQIDSLALAPEPAKAPPPRPERAPRSAPRPAEARVRIDALAAAPAPAPTRSSRAFRVAAASKTDAARPRVGIEPLGEAVSPAAPAPMPTRARRSAAPARRERTTPRPALEAPALSAASTARTATAASPRRTARAAPARASRSAATLSAAALALPDLAAGSGPPSPPTTALAAPARRRRQAPEEAAQRRGTDERPLEGVPLGSLSSCMSDREEDLLKQKLVAAVTTHEECVSDAGRYRFLQTRNLNAFLMWIERAPSRGPADRCVELTHALECLRRQARKESREG